MKKVQCRHCGGSTRCSCNHCSANSAIGVADICKACDGTAKVTIADDATSCPHCGGSTVCACIRCGNGLGGAALCHACKGKGYV